jgi:hypothetical protein
MDRKTVTKIFIAACILLPVQYGLVGIIGVIDHEPWPAFVFPGFKSVYVYDDGYQIDRDYFELIDRDGGVLAQLNPHDLFPELPRSQISGFMRSHFSDLERVSEFSSEARLWLQQQSRDHGGASAERLDVVTVRLFFSQDNQSAEPDSVVEHSRISIQLEGG